MDKIIFFLAAVLLLTCNTGYAKSFNAPQLELIADAKRQGEQVILTITGRTAQSFHLYSVVPQGEFGPKPTRLILKPSDLHRFGELSESKPKLMFDQALGESYLIHQGDFWVSQTFDKKASTEVIQGYLFYQLCDNLICLTPIKQPFEARIR